MLSASSPFLWLPLTKPELGKFPPNFAGGRGWGHSVVLGAVTCPCPAARCPFTSSESAFPFQCSPAGSVGRLHTARGSPSLSSLAVPALTHSPVLIYSFCFRLRAVFPLSVAKPSKYKI